MERNRSEALLDRAVAREELSVCVDRELALDLLSSPLDWRMIVNRKRVSLAELNLQAHVLAVALKAAGKLGPE